MNLNLKKLHFRDLLVIFGDLLDELKSRDIVRTRNNPVADYSEWLVSKAFNLTLQRNSNNGFDAIDFSGIKYQIKARRVSPVNRSRQLGVIRNLEAKKFDFLIAVIFDKDFSVLEAYKIPRNLISKRKYSRFSRHQNGYILVLRGEILTAEGVKRIDKQLNSYIVSSGIK